MMGGLLQPSPDDASCFACAAGLPAGAMAASPQRVLSLNLCTDQLLMALLPPQRIASITWLSRTEGDPALQALARQLPINHGSPEEVLAARPDLVLAGKLHHRQYARAAASRGDCGPRSGCRLPDWEGIRRVTLQVAAALGAEPRAHELLAAMDCRSGATGARAPVRNRCG